MSECVDTPLVMDALDMAWQRRQPEGGLLHRSDWGCQYTSDVYRQLLSLLQAIQSLNHDRETWNNAMRESAFSTLKGDLDLLRQSWA